jgi:hypothetical protein
MSWLGAMIGRRGRREDVVRRQHQHVRLDLRLDGQRQVDRHLVAVEVRVEARADQRVDAIALPSTSTGSNAWMPMRCRVGARLSSTGCWLITSSRMSQTSSSLRSSIFLADLIVSARPMLLELAG